MKSFISIIWRGHWESIVLAFHFCHKVTVNDTWMNYKWLGFGEALVCFPNFRLLGKRCVHREKWKCLINIFYCFKMCWLNKKHINRKKKNYVRESNGIVNKILFVHHIKTLVFNQHSYLLLWTHNSVL